MPNDQRSGKSPVVVYVVRPPHFGRQVTTVEQYLEMLSRSSGLHLSDGARLVLWRLWEHDDIERTVLRTPQAVALWPTVPRMNILEPPNADFAPCRALAALLLLRCLRELNEQGVGPVVVSLDEAALASTRDRTYRLHPGLCLATHRCVPEDLQCAGTHYTAFEART